MNNIVLPTTRIGANSFLLGVGVAAMLSGAFSANQVMYETNNNPKDDFQNYRMAIAGTKSTQGSNYSVSARARVSTGTARLEAAASQVYHNLVTSQESLGEEFTASLSSRLWDLYEV